MTIADGGAYPCYRCPEDAVYTLVLMDTARGGDYGEDFCGRCAQRYTDAWDQDGLDYSVSSIDPTGLVW